MNFEFSPQVKELQKRVSGFMEEHIYPNEERFYAEIDANRNDGNAWVPTKIIEELKSKARAEGLWNLWRPKAHGGTLTNIEYASLCEIMGRVTWAPEVFNCSAPDTGNMETILRYGTPEQQKQWAEPLLEGQMRSAFLMTEPEVASSDATNIQCRIERKGEEYVIN
ncbi:MAG: acyl-CoA dehydrogenase, partial [Burkholderiales bacterium]|nr:acyl-CoA dehydrogenase [Burkholderiales bacterium]